jgi:hypothetical protein
MKNKTGILLLLALVISNAAWFWYHYSMKQKRHGRGPGKMKELITREVGFNAEQEAAFGKIFDANAATAKTIMDSIGLLKKTYVENMSLEQKNDSTQLNYASKIGSLIATMTSNSYKNLMIDARKICKPDQLDKYDSIVKNFLIRTPRRGGRNQ